MKHNLDNRLIHLSDIIRNDSFGSLPKEELNKISFSVIFPNNLILPTLCLLSSVFKINNFITDNFKPNEMVTIGFSYQNPMKFIHFCSKTGAVIVKLDGYIAEDMRNFARSFENLPMVFENDTIKEIYKETFVCFDSTNKKHSNMALIGFLLMMTFFVTKFVLFYIRFNETKLLDKSPKKEKEYKMTHFLLSETNDISPGMKKLFKYLKVDDKITNVDEANKFCQQSFIRKAGIERNQMEPNVYESKYDELEPIFDELNMVRSIPASGHYKYLCFNGQSLPQMRRQMEFIKRQTNLTWDHIVFAAGERVISDIDVGDPLYGREDVKLETDGAQLLLDEYYPNENGFVVKATTKGTELPRPNTRSTVISWLEGDAGAPEPGSILMVSNNPFIGYQYLTWYIALKEHDWFKNGGSLDFCGDCLRKYRPNKVAVTFDNIARELYVEIMASKME